MRLVLKIPEMSHVYFSENVLLSHFARRIKLSACFSLSLLTLISSYANDTIRIMPVGNSITAGEHYNLPSLEERTGYRKPLYEMLVKHGYSVDFVGSQKNGIRPKSDRLCPSAKFWISETYENNQINQSDDQEILLAVNSIGILS